MISEGLTNKIGVVKKQILLNLCFDGVCLNITFQVYSNDKIQGF